MKIYSTIFILIVSLYVHGQPTKNIYPGIKKYGKNVKEFIPNRWAIIDSIRSDFNNDKKIDYAFVIQGKDSLKVSDLCINRYPFYPKMLVIVFQVNNDKFELSGLGYNLFGNCNDGIQGQDRYQKIYKRDNSIVVQFEYGGTLREIDNFYFKYVGHKWLLTHAEHEAYQQGQPELGSYHVKLNLISKSKEEYEQDQSSKKTSYRKSIIESLKPIQLENFNGEFPVHLEQ